MAPLLQVHSPDPIRQPVAESRMSSVAGASLPRGPWWSGVRERSDSSGVTSGAVTRAIEDLKRSGYRPLHPGPAGPPRASIPGYRPPEPCVTGLMPI